MIVSPDARAMSMMSISIPLSVWLHLQDRARAPVIPRRDGFG
jgi:hypothetical protein